MILALLLTSVFSAQTPEPAAPAAPATAPIVETADADALIAAGLKAFARSRFAAAAKSFGQAVDAAPDSAAANYYLGYAVYKQAEGKRPNHPDKARAAALFAKALSLDPQFRPVWAGPASRPPAQ